MMQMWLSAKSICLITAKLDEYIMKAMTQSSIVEAPFQNQHKQCTDGQCGHGLVRQIHNYLFEG